MVKNNIVKLVERIIQDKINENAILFQNPDSGVFYPDKSSLDTMVVYEIVDEEDFKNWQEFFVLATFTLKNEDKSKEIKKTALLNIRFASEKCKEAMEAAGIDLVSVDTTFYDEWQPAIDELDRQYSFNVRGCRTGFVSHYDTIDFKTYFGDATTGAKELSQ